VPFGKLVGLRVIVTPEPIVTVYDRLPVLLAPSVAVIVKLDAAAVVGVPDRTPLELNVNPVGKVPEVFVYV